MTLLGETPQELRLSQSCMNLKPEEVMIDGTYILLLRRLSGQSKTSPLARRLDML